MTTDDLDLLGRFTRGQSEEAFTALVERHLSLVYSAALRQVRSPELAEEVCQTVFTNLAAQAAKLKPGTVLTAWLYQVTRNTAIDVVRREARRQAREQIAFQMREMNDPTVDWTPIEPLLDEAMHSLEEPDRTALLLRFFENKSLREVGEALGASEDAAQKRVSRALERLRDFFAKREIKVGASTLAALVSAHAVQAAPSGLTGIVAGAALSQGALSAAITITETITMTTMQKTVIGIAAAGAVAIGIYQAREVSNLREQVQTMKQQQVALAALTNEVQELQRERDRATNAVAALSGEIASLRRNPNEVLKLRGEVGKLRQENISIGSSSALSKVTANPESRKLMRDQQKMAMTMIYKSLVNRLKLSEEQTEQFNDLLADHIMDNVDQVTTVLRDKPSPEEIDRIFGAQEAAMQEKIKALIGEEGGTQYQDYTHNLLSSITADQFKGMMSGDGSARDEKVKQMSQMLQEEVKAALSGAGLPANYQVVPMLNFRNIASEQEGDRSVKLLDDIYQRFAARGSSFLSAEELAKFEKFRETALSNNRAALSMNRALMAPIAQK